MMRCLSFSGFSAFSFESAFAFITGGIDDFATPSCAVQAALHVISFAGCAA